MTRIIVGKRESRESYWRGQIASCESSGKSIVQYCRDEGLSLSKYHWWKSELGRRSALEAQTSSFAEVRVALPSDPSGALIEVALGGQRRVRVWPGFDPETLGQVLRVLEEVSC